MPSSAVTPYPLGVYVGVPDVTNAAAESVFDQSYVNFTNLMGTQAVYMDTYIDSTEPISEWLHNTDWAVDSFLQSPSAKGMIPVIGLPMASSAAGSPSADQMYKNFANGSYDSIIQSLVKAWAAAGYTTQYWRPGLEMNLSDSPSYAGSDATTQADWVKAFQHIYTVIHAAAAADGVSAQVIWNPSTTNYSGDGVATQTLYPGNQYVDIIGADVYGDLYPYGTATSIYDWDKSGQVLNSSKPVYDTSIQQWASDPVNLEHYYTYPASDQWSLDASGGNCLSLQNIIDFAKAEGKPVALPETGAGNTNDDGANLSDNPAFVQWLASTLENAGVKVDFVNIWDSNAGGTYEFSSPGDDKPLEAAAWAKYFGAETTAATPITVTPATRSVSTTGVASVTPFAGIAITDGNAGQTETATVTLSAAANGTLSDPNAATDGSKISNGVLTVSGSAASVATALDGLVFTPSASSGTAGSAVVTTVTAAVKDTAGETASAASTITDTVAATPTATPTTDTIVLDMSEDYADGDAQFTVSVNGHQIGGDYQAHALHASGDAGTVSLTGNWGSGVNDVEVSFINHAYGRNLYVNSIAENGVTYAGTSAAFPLNGSHTFAVGGTTPTEAAPADTVTLQLSEDAWEGNAMFVLYIDGKAVTSPEVVSALHNASQTQGFTFTGNLGAGTHTIGIACSNHAYGPTTSVERDLYVNGITLNGSSVFAGATPDHVTNRMVSFAVTTAH